MTGCTSVRLDVYPIMDGVANECATHCNSGLFMQVNGVIVDHFVKIFFADISQIFRARIGTRPTKKYPAGTDRIDFTGLHARNVVLEIEDVGGVNLVTQPLGYLLNIEPDSVDVHRFRRLFAEADNHDGPDRVAAVWDEALALWRGEPLTGITGSWSSTNVTYAGSSRSICAISMPRGHTGRLANSHRLRQKPSPHL
jgi:Bacterial transcriptional activator domain